MPNRLVIAMLLLLTVNLLSAATENNDLTATSVSTSTTTSTISVSRNPETSISRNIFAEFGGPSFGIGIGYDQRFRPNTIFGFRTGMSFTKGSWDDGGWFGAHDGGTYTEVDFKGVTIPLEVNVIMGQRASKFELGVGATPCILHRHEVEYWGWHPEHSGTDIKDGVRLNIFGTLNIGYRLQRKSGFFLRTGFTFLFADLKCSPIDGLLFIPNLSIGYTLK